MKVDFKVEGLEHLRDVLTRELPQKAQQKVMTRALKTALRPMARTVRTAYRGLGGSGALAQATSIWQRRKGVSRETFASVELGPKRASRGALNKYYNHYRRTVRPKTLMAGIRHGHLVEFGFTHRGGRSVAGKNILGAAAQRHAPQATSDFGAILGAEIEREARRLAARQRPGR